MVDSAQWDERQIAAKSEREFKHAMMRSDLEQQKFSNRMQEKGMQLREAGFALEAEMHEKNLRNADQQYQRTKNDMAFDNKRRPLMLEEQKLKLEGQTSYNEKTLAEATLAVDKVSPKLFTTEYLRPEDLQDQATLDIINTLS
jgi:hypothetical protein